MRRHYLRAVPFASIAFAAIACGDPAPQPIEKTAALGAANGNVKAILVGGARAGVMLDDSAFVEGIAKRSWACPSEPGGASDNCVDLALEQSANSAAEELADRILNLANVESEEGTRIVVRLAPERICA